MRAGALPRWGWALAALAWAALIYWASSRPHPFPFLPAGLLELDKLLHLLAYAVLGGLLVGPFLPRFGAARAAVAAAAIATAYGAADEWHQSFVPNRSADPKDLAADAAGAVLGAAAMALALRVRRARASIRG